MVLRSLVCSAAATTLFLLGTHTAAVASAEGGEEHEGTWLNWVFALRVGGKPLVEGEAGLALAWSLAAVLLLVVFVVLATRRLSVRPKGVQILLEMVVGALRSMVVGIMGERGIEFLPFLGTLFIYIAFMNLLGLLPGFMAPTSNLSITAGLALMVFVIVHYYGFREAGLGYFRHFIAGVPVQFPYVLLAPLVCVIHIVGELVRPVTLALRLFGNLMAGHKVLVILVGLVIGAARHWIPLPIQLPNMALEVLVSLVQAMIFSMLTAVYLDGVLHREGAEEH